MPDDLATLGEKAHQYTISKGWWTRPLEERVPRLLRWLHEEVEEAEKAWAESQDLREPYPPNRTWYEADAEGHLKPEGLPSELADIYLLLSDICAGLTDHGYDVDLTEAVAEKFEYNKVRKYRRDAKGE